MIESRNADYLVGAVEIENASVIGEESGMSGQFRKGPELVSSPPPGVLDDKFTTLLKFLVTFKSYGMTLFPSDLATIGTSGTSINK